MKMSQAFASNGHEVVLCVPKRKSEEEKNIDDIYAFYAVDNIFKVKKISFINVRFLRNFFYAFKCLLAIFETKPNLVYGRDLFACFFSAFFFNTSYEAHAPMDSLLKKCVLNSLLKRKKFKSLIVISEALKTIMSQEHDIENIKVVVAHDGADIPKNTDTKIKLKGSEHALKVGYVGQLYKGKGMELISSLLPLVAEDIEFHVVGGMESDLLYWRNVTSGYHNIHFYGFLPQSELHQYINAFDVCLLPNQKVVLTYGAKNNKSNISGFTSPLKMFEYMSYAKAIISSDLPVLREVLSEGNSILCSPDSPEEWAAALLKLKNSELRRELATSAYNSFLSEYSWKKRAGSVI